jgi:hypothetical protein
VDDDDDDDDDDYYNIGAGIQGCSLTTSFGTSS